MWLEAGTPPTGPQWQPRSLKATSPPPPTHHHHPHPDPTHAYARLLLFTAATLGTHAQWTQYYFRVPRAWDEHKTGVQAGGRVDHNSTSIRGEASRLTGGVLVEGIQGLGQLRGCRGVDTRV